VTPDEWPPVALARVDVQTNPQYSGLTELTPLYDRRPYGDWCHLLWQLCEADPTLDWKGAGFVSCRPDEVQKVQARLAELTADTNAEFRAFLGRVLEKQPHDGHELIALEQSLAASRDDRAYLCGWI